jgi:hypothetical protein
MAALLSPSFCKNSLRFTMPNGFLLKDGAVLRLGLHAAYDTKVPGG